MDAPYIQKWGVFWRNQVMGVLPTAMMLRLQTEAERKEFEWEYGVLKLPQYLLTHEYINVPKRIRPSDTPINSSLPCALTT